MKLISATPSPYARKVRIALAEKDIPFELRTEVPWNDDTTLPLHNPLEKLPVLILDDGTALYESSFILEWIERKHPEPPLLPDDTDGILAHKQLDALATGTCDALLLLFFERLRPRAHQSEPWMGRQRRKVQGALAAIAGSLGTQDYLVRGEFGLADLSAGSLLGWMAVRFPEIDWRRDHPALGAYMDRLMRRASFRDTVPYPQTITSPVV